MLQRAAVYFFGAGFTLPFLSPECPWNVRVGANSPSSYNLQARFPAIAVALLNRMQTRLTQEVSVPVHVVPDSALHLSIYSAVPFFWPDEAKEPFWQSQREPLLQMLPEISEECSVVELEFESSTILPSAVVAMIRDRTDTIRSIRERLAQFCRHPTLPAPSYNLLHCTLCRFAADETIPAREVQRYEAHWERFATPLGALALVRERRYPSLELEDVAAATF